MSAMNPQLFSVAEAAEALSISVWSVRHLVRTGQLARVRIGTRVLISAAELQRFIDAHTEPCSTTTEDLAQTEIPR